MRDRSLLNLLWPWPLTQQPKKAHNQLNIARKPLETICNTWNSKRQFKSYMHQIFMAAILDFDFLCISCKKLQGRPPRLCSWIFVGIISIGQPFTAGHVCFHKKWWFGSMVICNFKTPCLFVMSDISHKTRENQHTLALCKIGIAFAQHFPCWPNINPKSS